MADFKKLRADLEAFKRQAANEMLLNPIERWMKKELGVKRLPSRGGSAVLYEHEVLKLLNQTGHFSIHVRHKRREIIYRKNFLDYLYPRLAEIIDLMELEEKSE